MLAAASLDVDCWNGTCGICLLTARQGMTMWWLPRQPCRGFLVRSVSLSLLSGAMQSPALPFSAASETVVTPHPPLPPSLFFP